MTKHYRVAIIGSTGRGDYGHHLDLGWKAAPGVEIVAVADDNAAGRAEAARRLGVDKAFADYRAMLDESKPDIVAVCPRWLDQHAQMSIACAERGIHVYMEKPFCRDLAEADAIIAACDRTHARLTLAHPARHSPMWATVRELVTGGKLGQILEFRARGKEDQRGGGEDLWVLGSHPLDMILDLAGSPVSCSAEVLVNNRPISRDDVYDGPEGIGPLAGDRVNATFRHAGGERSFFASVRGAGRTPPRFALQIFGTDGVLEIVQTQEYPTVNYLRDPAWSPGRSGAKWQPVSTAGIDVTEPLDKSWPNVGHGPGISNLLKAIETNTEAPCNPRESRRIIEMILAVFESQRLGRPAVLPLERRTNPLLSLS